MASHFQMACVAVGTAMSLLSAASPARAHDGVIQISCTADSPSRLIVRAAPGLLTGDLSIELLPGDGPFAGRWLHDEPAIQTLEADQPTENRRRLRPDHRLALKRLHMPPGLTFYEPSTFKPILTRDGDTFVFAHDARGDFGIQMICAAARAGIYKASFQFVDRAGRHADSQPFTLAFRTVARRSAASQSSARYICPMRCEGDATYAAPRRCPDCGMKLADVKAHRDHAPKHGGQFFMASDQIHHLEGALAGPREFRVYFYDEYTQPIAADRFTASGSVRATANVLKQSPPTATATAPAASAPKPDDVVPLIFRPHQSHDYLIAAVPAASQFPIRIRLWIDFHDGGSAQLFEFEFSS